MQINGIEFSKGLINVNSIAAARVNGLEQFLEALKIGVVVRRHWPRGKSVFVLLSSDDGGDSIQ